MKKLLITILAALILSFAFGQVPNANFEMKTDNFRQVDETTISWELWIKKTSGDDFGLYQWQLQWQFDQTILNGGEFISDNFTVEPGADGQVFLDHYDNLDAVVSTSAPLYFSHTPTTFPSVGDDMTLITSEWKHIATYTAQLTKDGSPHNFISSDVSFAHRIGGVVELTASTNPHQTDNNGQINGSLNPSEGVSINEHQLASHFFTGDGLWSETARWNNVTTENANTLPGNHDNVLIKGNVTIDDSRSLTASGGNGGQITVLTGPPPPTYTLTLDGGAFDGFTTEQIVGGEYDGENTGEFTAGSVITIETTNNGNPIVFQNWSAPSGSFADATLESTNYTMPGNDVTVTANWSFGKKDGTSINITTIDNNLKLSKANKNSLNSSLTIAHNGSLTVDKLFNENENGADAVVIESNSNGTGSLIVNESASGDITAKRYLPDGAWHYVTPKTTGVTSGDFFFNNEPVVWLTEYDELNDEWNYIETLDTPLPVGSGYSIWLDTETKTSATAVMKGEIQVTNVTVALTQGDGDGFNLVGNPYTSALDWATIAGSEGITGTTYVWDNDMDADGGYITHNGAEGLLPGGTVPPGQAFFVQANDGSKVDFTIPATARKHANSNIYKGGTAQNEDVPYVKLEMEHEAGYLNTIFVGFPEDGTAQFDAPGDVTKLYDNADSPQFFIIEDGKELSTNTRQSIEADQEQTAPVHLVQVLDGEYSITLHQRENLSDINFVLEDLKNDVIHDFDEDGLTYSFEGYENDAKERFILHFTKAGTIGLEENERADRMMRVYSNNQQITIASEGAFAREDGIVKVYDVYGRLVMNENIQASSEVRLESPLTMGVAVIEVIKPSGIKTEKLLIK